jgi:hypothetical protein
MSPVSQSPPDAANVTIEADPLLRRYEGINGIRTFHNAHGQTTITDANAAADTKVSTLGDTHGTPYAAESNLLLFPQQTNCRYVAHPSFLACKVAMTTADSMQTAKQGYKLVFSTQTTPKDSENADDGKSKGSGVLENIFTRAMKTACKSSLHGLSSHA